MLHQGFTSVKDGRNFLKRHEHFQTVTPDSKRGGRISPPLASESEWPQADRVEVAASRRKIRRQYGCEPAPLIDSPHHPTLRVTPTTARSYCSTMMVKVQSSRKNDEPAGPTAAWIATV
jgi:hypothetical protein